MDIEAFIELCAGQWFSQRTSYYLGQEQAENSKTEIRIERLSANDPQVLELCDRRQLQPHVTLGGTRTSWQQPGGRGNRQSSGSAIVILVPEAGNPHRGQLLQATGSSPNKLLAGRYILGQDEALTLTLEEGQACWQERLWFASPNLRLRTSFIEQADGWSATAFYSEIRRIKNY